LSSTKHVTTRKVRGVAAEHHGWPVDEAVLFSSAVYIACVSICAYQFHMLAIGVIPCGMFGMLFEAVANICFGIICN
jgi:hypothetical protein